MINVYYILGMKKILISILQIMDKASSILFGPGIMEIYANVKTFKEFIIQGKKVNKLFVMFASNS